MKLPFAGHYQYALYQKQNDPGRHRKSVNVDERHDLLSQWVSAETFPKQIEAAKPYHRDDQYGTGRQQVEKAIRSKRAAARCLRPRDRRRKGNCFRHTRTSRKWKLILSPAAGR